MSKIEIDFNNLKYNLYEILNVPSDSDASKIKKSFMKLIKSFHPDKNSDLEEEIYNHIILANQILLNENSRMQYDTYLIDRVDSFNDLKSSFNKTIKEVDTYFPEKSNSVKMFANMNTMLNQKHGFTDTNDLSVMERFSKIKSNRNQEDFVIEKEDIKSTTDFNQRFTHNKVDGKFKNQIVEYKGQPNELSTYVVGENFTSLADLDKLYIEDSVQCSKYSSLDRAFMLQPVETNNTNKTIDDKMKDYKSQSDNIKNMKPTDFSTKKFNEWA
jgi:curved DNA-binding protein CbpA